MLYEVITIEVVDPKIVAAVEPRGPHDGPDPADEFLLAHVAFVGLVKGLHLGEDGVHDLLQVFLLGLFQGLDA